jgi:hypothetical protein
MTRELGGSERSARLGAILVLFNPRHLVRQRRLGPGRFGRVVFLLLAPARAVARPPGAVAILATVAALIKPQLGILIPIVALVVIRRAFWPKGGYGDEEPPERLPWTTGLEARIRGPIRVVTTGLAGLLTAILVSLPFGLSFPGLIAQIFKTAAATRT